MPDETRPVTDEDPTAKEEDNEELEFEELYELEEKEKSDILSEFDSRLVASESYMTTLHPSMLALYKKYRSVADPIVDQDGNVAR